MTPTNFPPGLAPSPNLPAKEDPLMEVAKKLEATFLAEMLKSAGFGAARSEFGGGTGEDQFGSFLRQAQADEMVKTGGIGLAQALFDSIKEIDDGHV